MKIYVKHADRLFTEKLKNVSSYYVSNKLRCANYGAPDSEGKIPITYELVSVEPRLVVIHSDGKQRTILDAKNLEITVVPDPKPI